MTCVHMVQFEQQRHWKYNTVWKPCCFQNLCDFYVNIFCMNWFCFVIFHSQLLKMGTQMGETKKKPWEIDIYIRKSSFRKLKNVIEIIKMSKHISFNTFWNKVNFPLFFHLSVCWPSHNIKFTIQYTNKCWSGIYGKNVVQKSFMRLNFVT